MAIPTNLLPINNPFNNELNDLNVPNVEIPKPAIPTNLLPVNVSDINSSLQSLAGQIPELNVPEIPQYPILNVVIPDNLFKTGSLDQIRQRTLRAAEIYVNGLPSAPTIPAVPTITLPFPPKRPSYGQIKNFIKTKIDRIKQQRQKASLKALNEELKQRENPFAYQQSLKNAQISTITNNVLGRFKNL